jgi:hypothetical protein
MDIYFTKMKSVIEFISLHLRIKKPHLSVEAETEKIYFFTPTIYNVIIL